MFDLSLVVFATVPIGHFELVASVGGSLPWWKSLPLQMAAVVVSYNWRLVKNCLREAALVALLESEKQQVSTHRQVETSQRAHS